MVTKLPPAAKPAKRGARLAILGLAAVVVLGGAFFAYTRFLSQPTPPPVVSKPKTAPAPAAGNAAPSTPAGTPSDTLNKAANAPANAIQKAKDAVNARNESGQSRVDVALEGTDVSRRPAAAAQSPKTSSSTGAKTLSPGVSASTPLQAAPEASVPFRTFVANAKISGVVATRAIVNGKLTRAGDMVDQGLGITFEGYDTEKNQLLFKDRSGALVARRYP